MELTDITPLILTWNEGPNIARCLEKLRWASQVVIVDSGSNDETLERIARFPNALVATRAFDSHSQQWNFGIAEVSTNWVLALDADFIVSESLPGELENLEPGETVAFRSCFRYCVNGTPLRGSLYPARTVLFRRDRCSYIQDGHTQLLIGDEDHGFLSTKIDHDDRKPLSRWLSSQEKYASLEAGKLLSTETSEMMLPDRVRRTIWLAAPATLIFTLFVKGTLLDGWKGLFYALQRTYAELLLSLELLSRKLDAEQHSHSPDE